MSEEKKKDYVVLADGQTVFEFNERGDMIHKSRHSKGDTVSLTEAQAAGLLRHGGVREAGAATGDADGGTPATEPAEPVGGSGETFSDEDLPFDEGGIYDVDDNGNVVGRVENDVEPVDSEENLTVRQEQEGGDDDYESMEYADLQALAKRRTGNGGGSKADLVQRLRDHDAS